MKMVTEATISASHFLPDHVGKCKNLHGHNWRVRVMIKGSLIEVKGDPQNGMITDFGKVKEVLNPFDHKHLNDVMGNVPPTAENISKCIGEKIISLQTNIIQVVIQIYESDKSYIEWNSDDDWEEKSTRDVVDVIEDAAKQLEADKDIRDPDEEEEETDAESE